MTLYEVYWSDYARSCFREILITMKRDGFPGASWASKVLTAITKLEHHPMSRRIVGVASTGDDIRRLVVGSHCLYYRVLETEKRVEVIYIVHASKVDHPEWLHVESES